MSAPQPYSCSDPPFLRHKLTASRCQFNMRLLNARTLDLEEFPDDRVAPSYAILSHRWEDEEVSFKDVLKNRTKGKKGFRKVELSCKQAVLDGITHVWVDTCCIDRKSSAELSEAINAMYKWYKNAEVCYAYLFDVAMNAGSLEESDWFTRGWTLQELIAPRVVTFYDAHWRHLGSKFDLSQSISQTTKIPESALLGIYPIENYSIAQKMSWASKRATTRIEDIAYSLMGLFGVNMPMLYGEGQRAFQRLQEEIIKRSADDSIFAWETSNTISPSTLFAPSPLEFTNCADVTWDSSLATKGYSITNVGLQITLTLIPWSMDIYLGLLKSSKTYQGMPMPMRIGIFLRYKLVPVESYVRVHHKARSNHSVCLSPWYGPALSQPPEGTSVLWIGRQSGGSAFVEGDYVPSITYQEEKALFTREVVIRPHLDPTSLPVQAQRYGYHLDVDVDNIFVLCEAQILSWTERSDDADFLEIPDGFRGTVGVLFVPDTATFISGARSWLLKLGFDFFFRPIFLFSRAIWGKKPWNLAPTSNLPEDRSQIMRCDWIENVANMDYNSATAQEQWDACGYFIFRPTDNTHVRINMLGITLTVARTMQTGWRVHLRFDR